MGGIVNGSFTLTKRWVREGFSNAYGGTKGFGVVLTWPHEVLTICILEESRTCFCP